MLTEVCQLLRYFISETNLALLYMMAARNILPQIRRIRYQSQPPGAAHETENINPLIKHLDTPFSRVKHKQHKQLP